MTEKGDGESRARTPAPLLSQRVIINARGQSVRRCDDPDLRRAMVTLLAASLGRNRPVGERTLEALEERSKQIAALLGDPASAFRRQDAERSLLIGTIYRRIRFGPRAATITEPVVEIQRKYELERRRRIAAEARVKKSEGSAADRRLRNAVAIIKETELRWSLSSKGKAVHKP